MEIEINNTYRLVIQFKDFQEKFFLERDGRKLNLFLTLMRPPKVFRNPEVPRFTGFSGNILNYDFLSYPYFSISYFIFDIVTEIFGMMTTNYNDAWTRDVFESPKGILEVASVYLSMTNSPSLFFLL